MTTLIQDTTIIGAAEAPIFPANKVIVVGLIDTMLIPDPQGKRDRETNRRPKIEATRKEARNFGKGGTREEFAIQVRSPYGGMFAIRLELEPDVPGAELIRSAQADTLLAFEGTLQLKQTFDPRFARQGVDFRGRIDRGKPTRALHLLVSVVRMPLEEERRASSAVWLEGTVLEPPQVSRHPDIPSMQLAGTILRVTFGRPSDFPGLDSLIDETIEVNVCVPTTNPNAEGMYRQGNRVRLVGQIDCRMERQAGDTVVKKLEEIDAEWKQKQTELANQPVQLRNAEQSYRRRRQQFEEVARLYVLGLRVELVSGEPIPLGETFEMRREFVAADRKRRQERRERLAADTARREAQAGGQVEQGSGHNVAESIHDMPVIASVVDVGTDPAAGTTKPTRPRRPVRDVVEQASEPVEPIQPAEASGAAEPVLSNGAYGSDGAAGNGSAE